MPINHIPPPATSIDVVGGPIVHTLTEPGAGPGTAATALITLPASPSAGQTITINGAVFNAVSGALGPDDYSSASQQAAAQSLRDAINASDLGTRYIASVEATMAPPTYQSGYGSTNVHQPPDSFVIPVDTYVSIPFTVAPAYDTAQNQSRALLLGTAVGNGSFADWPGQVTLHDANLNVLQTFTLPGEGFVEGISAEGNAVYISGYVEDAGNGRRRAVLIYQITEYARNQTPGATTYRVRINARVPGTASNLTISGTGQTSTAITQGTNGGRGQQYGEQFEWEAWLRILDEQGLPITRLRRPPSTDNTYVFDIGQFLAGEVDTVPPPDLNALIQPAPAQWASYSVAWGESWIGDMDASGNPIYAASRARYYVQRGVSDLRPVATGQEPEADRRDMRYYTSLPRAWWTPHAVRRAHLQEGPRWAQIWITQPPGAIQYNLLVEAFTRAGVALPPQTVALSELDDGGLFSIRTDRDALGLPDTVGRVNLTLLMDDFEYSEILTERYFDDVRAPKLIYWADPWGAFEQWHMWQVDEAELEVEDDRLSVVQTVPPSPELGRRIYADRQARLIRTLESGPLPLHQYEVLRGLASARKAWVIEAGAWVAIEIEEARWRVEGRNQYGELTLRYVIPELYPAD